MISVDLTKLEENSKEFLDMLTENKTKEFRKEMIKFLNEGYWGDTRDHRLILEFINDFFVVCPYLRKDLEEELEENLQSRKSKAV